MALQIRTSKELKQKTTPKMICPKVLILTLFIVGTFAKDTMENMEERFKAMEKELIASKMETIESNKRIEEMEKKLVVFEENDIETNKRFKDVEKRVRRTLKVWTNKLVNLDSFAAGVSLSKVIRVRFGLWTLEILP